MKKEYLPYGEDKEGRAIWECLNRMYRETEPKADIERILKSGEGKMPNFFMAYYLADERICEIIKEVCGEFEINKIMEKKVENTLWMGCAPCSSNKMVKKHRKDFTKRLKKFLKEEK